MPRNVEEGVGGLVEGAAAGAGALRGGVVDREARRLERVDEIDGRLAQVRHAHLVDHQADAELLLGLVLLA